MRELPNRKIVWAIHKPDHMKGRPELGEGGDKVFSNLNLWDTKAEAACVVAILKGHPNTEKCAAYYQRMGADVILFDPAKPSVPAAPKVIESDRERADRFERELNEIKALLASKNKKSPSEEGK